MLLLASRPSRTYFGESPLGWYLYRWDMATTPAFVEFWELNSFGFLALHLLAVVAVVWLLRRWAVRQPTRLRAAPDAEPGAAADTGGRTGSS